jgi:hypothetical protein
VLSSLNLQAKLAVGPVGDRYEQEADRMAAQVTWMPTPTPAQSPQRQVDRIALTGRYAANPAYGAQRQAAPDGSFEASSALEDGLAAQRGGGQPLSAETRAFMEPRFGADFSGVRVHTGSAAAGLSHSIGARAFTHGQDIYFGENQYAPGSGEGRHLLAHELTHTLEQGAARQVRGWWPTGHKLVTELAIEKGDFGPDGDVLGRSPTAFAPAERRQEQWMREYQRTRVYTSQR